uniref:Chromo domain-containing protein n=1 Tax=Ananas comosus var. bracteatus TaxID=296719 RepID=A0A6V7NEP6_ANACO|nr:unnamed protein product [Ananas comosus var. bracteatus]
MVKTRFEASVAESQQSIPDSQQSVSERVADSRDPREGHNDGGARVDAPYEQTLMPPSGPMAQRAEQLLAIESLASFKKFNSPIFNDKTDDPLVVESWVDKIEKLFEDLLIPDRDKNRFIPYVKILWINYEEWEATWELESIMRECFPHLFGWLV